jgi:hypothetical protein
MPKEKKKTPPPPVQEEKKVDVEKEKEADPVTLLPVAKKRGRKPKVAAPDVDVLNDNNCIISSNNNPNITCTITEKEEEVEEENDKPVAKKRGRKPKGGKIIQQVVLSSNAEETKPNVILHLKCSLNDLKTDTLTSSNVESYNFDTGDLSYEIIMNENNNSEKLQLAENANNANIIIINNNEKCYNEEDYEEDDFKKETDNKEIWKKLKHLEHNLHVNNISDKKSACFWCTYEFDNPQIYIPKYFIKDSYHVYGCFCSPECATAFLMEENIDSSIRFERYHLLNNIYSKIYNFKKNIKPAANPYYMLEKYYGNLTIQEYRALLRNERLFLIVDKPLTRILPELHEDNDDFIINNKIIPSNTYQVKKKPQKKAPNVSIFSDKFGSASSS